MSNLIDIDDLSKNDILQIWESINNADAAPQTGKVAWSFEGNGIRTRTTFIQAFQGLGLSFVELPNFLKSNESVTDLAGYMDAFYNLYVLRESNHDRLQQFAEASKRPVINAMSNRAHPCEVLTDAYYLHTQVKPIESLNILLWGPSTNVFQSWHALARVLGFRISQYCPMEMFDQKSDVQFVNELDGNFDVLITDAWPAGFEDLNYQLTENHLQALGQPLLLPTPPVFVGREIAFTPSQSSCFVGYQQKALLLPVQQAIVSYFLN